MEFQMFMLMQNIFEIHTWGGLKKFMKMHTMKKWCVGFICFLLIPFHENISEAPPICQFLDLN